MVDLTQRGEGRKKQRAFHMNDDTHARLARAAELTNSTMSAVLDRLIWENLRLPEDDAAPAAVPAPTGRALEIAERAANADPKSADPKSPDAMNAKAMDRLRKRGRFATRVDGSDQRENDPDNMGRGGDNFDL